jgi:hypothetical protein
VPVVVEVTDDRYFHALVPETRDELGNRRGRFSVLTVTPNQLTAARSQVGDWRAVAAASARYRCSSWVATPDRRAAPPMVTPIDQGPERCAFRGHSAHDRIPPEGGAFPKGQRGQTNLARARPVLNY